jgi:hypothetical protein
VLVAFGVFAMVGICVSDGVDLMGMDDEGEHRLNVLASFGDRPEFVLLELHGTVESAQYLLADGAGKAIEKLVW